MPSLDENKRLWDGAYDWSQGGDEWSAAWGGTDRQWSMTLWPRVRAYLPVSRILEIAPGYGRWTQYLAAYCEEFVGVDLAAGCVEACRTRFADDARVSFFQNNGYTFPDIADGSVDFTFSFDSLVHAEADVLSSYLGELGRILSAEGIAFIHHSNVGAYPPAEQDSARNDWRATSVSADLIVTLAKISGLAIRVQELFPWGGQPILSDCISVICRVGSSWATESSVRAENRAFMEEARQAQMLAALYRPIETPDQ